jgi:2-methylcitrate dehydratase PrpD
LIAGLEISLRIAEATHVGKEGYSRGWIATSSICQFGAAVVAGRLLGLTVEQMVHALAHAGAHPCGTWATGLTMAKRVAIGRAAETGVLAAFMAAQGITAGDTVFDGEWGTIGSIISPTYEPDLLTKELGEAWRTLTVGLKCSPTKGGVQSALDAVLEIVQREPNLKPEDVERILIRTTRGVAFNKAFATFPPHDFWEAQNSLPYILASAFVDRNFGLEQLGEDRLHDQRILTLASKVKLEHSEEADQQPPESKTAFVDVSHRDGKVRSTRVDYPRGEPENPLTTQQLHAKFREVAKFGLTEQGMANVIKTVSSMEQLANVRSLTAQLVSPAGFGVRA